MRRELVRNEPVDEPVMADKVGMIVLGVVILAPTVGMLVLLIVLLGAQLVANVL